MTLSSTSSMQGSVPRKITFGFGSSQTDMDGATSASIKAASMRKQAYQSHYFASPSQIALQRAACGSTSPRCDSSEWEAVSDDEENDAGDRKPETTNKTLHRRQQMAKGQRPPKNTFTTRRESGEDITKDPIRRAQEIHKQIRESEDTDRILEYSSEELRRAFPQLKITSQHDSSRGFNLYSNPLRSSAPQRESTSSTYVPQSYRLLNKFSRKDRWQHFMRATF